MHRYTCISWTPSIIADAATGFYGSTDTATACGVWRWWSQREITLGVSLQQKLMYFQNVELIKMVCRLNNFVNWSLNLVARFAHKLLFWLNHCASILTKGAMKLRGRDGLNAIEKSTVTVRRGRLQTAAIRLFLHWTYPQLSLSLVTAATKAAAGGRQCLSTL